MLTLRQATPKSYTNSLRLAAFYVQVGNGYSCFGAVFTTCYLAFAPAGLGTGRNRYR